MTKKIFTFLVFPFFFIAVAFFAGCSSPVGGLQATRNYIRADPKKTLYAKGATFYKKDVEVYYVFKGQDIPIDIDDVDIKIIEGNPFNEYPVNPESGQQLINPGSPAVEVYAKYLDMKVRYFIQVVAPGEVPGWSGGETGIHIIWPDK